MPWRVLGLLLALLWLAAVAEPAAANMARIVPGERAGAPFPQAEGYVGVTQERVTYDLRNSAMTPLVTAEYRLRAGSAGPMRLPVAFALYSLTTTPLQDARVSVDGQAVAVRPVWLHDLLWPRVQSWIREHPALAAQARKWQRLYDGKAYEQAEAVEKGLREAVTAAGLRADQDFDGYVALREAMAAGSAAAPGATRNPMAAVRLVAAAETDRLEGSWRQAPESWPDPRSGGAFSEPDLGTGGELALLIFDLDFRPGRRTHRPGPVPPAGDPQ